MVAYLVSILSALTMVSQLVRNGVLGKERGERKTIAISINIEPQYLFDFNFTVRQVGSTGCLLKGESLVISLLKSFLVFGGMVALNLLCSQSWPVPSKC